MKIIHLEKTFENVITHRNDDVFFLTATKSGGVKFNFQYASKRIETVALEDIQKYLDDPRTALVKVDMEAE